MHTKEWHTGEAYNWIANDEHLYLTAQKCKTAVMNVKENRK